MRGPYIDRFKAKIAVSPSGCWEWMASRTPLGYGQFNYLGTRKLAHRVAWILFVGPIPPDPSNRYGTMNVLHRCDNPRCVNPEHLFLGNQFDNSTDSVSKGRWGKRGLKGSAHGRARLTEEIVREILASTDSLSALADRYKVSRGTISHIRKRRSWRHL